MKREHGVEENRKRKNMEEEADESTERGKGGGGVGVVGASNGIASHIFSSQHATFAP